MTTKHTKKSNVWHVTLWVAQILLAGMFLMIGFMKTFVPIPELSKIVPIAAEMPALIRFIGVSELAGGLGLLLPAALRIWPHLTPLAAAGLVVVMLLAMIFHITRGESSSIGTNIVLGVLAALIAWGRVYKAPIGARWVGTNSAIKS